MSQPLYLPLANSMFIAVTCKIHLNNTRYISICQLKCQFFSKKNDIKKSFYLILSNYVNLFKKYKNI